MAILLPIFRSLIKMDLKYLNVTQYFGLPFSCLCFQFAKVFHLRKQKIQARLKGRKFLSFHEWFMLRSTLVRILRRVWHLMTPRRSRSQSFRVRGRVWDDGPRPSESPPATPWHWLRLRPRIQDLILGWLRLRPQPSLLLRQTKTHSTHTIQSVADFGPAGDTENLLLIVNLFSQRDFKWLARYKLIWGPLLFIALQLKLKEF